MTMANGQSHIDIADLPDEIRDPQYYSTSNPFALETLMQTNKLDKSNLLETLNRYHGDLTLTAEALGISRTTLWRYRKQFNL